MTDLNQFLYTEEQQQQEDNPIYTAEDMVPPVVPNVGEYPALKAVAQLATEQPQPEGEVDFKSHVDSEWRKVAPENDYIDRSIAEKAAVNTETTVLEDTLKSMRERNRMYGEISSQSAEDVRAKIKDLASTAVEKTVLANPAILINNTAEEIATQTDKLAKATAAQVTLEKAIEDGSKGWNVTKGLAYELTPFSAEQGAAIDRIAIKYGVPEGKISRLTGRSETISRLQLAFQSLSEEEKGQWLTGLYDDLRASMIISDWVAARVVGEVATNEEQTWGGFSDWADRLGAVGTVLTGAGALFKASKLLSRATAVNRAERLLAASGGKSLLVNAETAKIASQASRADRLRALGVVAGEVTGISTVIDLGKLVSMSAAKVLPDSVVLAAQDLQKVIRQPVDKLIGELQDVVAAKGIRSEEAAAQLEELNTFYSKANNPNIHSVDPFTMSADGVTISGKVLYKPTDASAYLTQEAATAALKALDPEGKLGMKVVPDATNNGFLVEEKVVADLKARKAAVEAQLLEVAALEKKLAGVKPTEAGGVKAGESGISDTTIAKAPKSLATSKPRWKQSGLNFESELDKALYQVGSKTKLSKSDAEVSAWIKAQTGWSDVEIKQAAQSIRNYIKENEDIIDDVGNIMVQEQKFAVKEGSESASGSAYMSARERQIAYQRDLDEQFAGLNTLKGITNDPSGISFSAGINGIVVSQFHSRLGKALGMSDRKILVLSHADLKDSKNALAKEIYDDIKNNHTNANGIHYDYGNGQSVIVMIRPVGQRYPYRAYVETFAHEYGHAFEAHFSKSYRQIMNWNFHKWLRAKGIKFEGQGTQITLFDKFSPEALLEYRAVSKAEDIMVWMNKWTNGDRLVFETYEKHLHNWAKLYSEFFAENFAKWAFTNEIPTTILGQAFSKLVEGFKLIVEEMNNVLRTLGIKSTAGYVDVNTAEMLEVHIEKVKANAIQSDKMRSMAASESRGGPPSTSALQKELADINDELSAIEDATKGLKSGWLIEHPIAKNIDYKAIGTYTDDDINSASRLAMGDWALSTSSELYAQRVVGINQQSRYQKLLTNFVRPSVERLNGGERVFLNDALTLGDKEGKVFTEAELAGQGLSPRAREAYYKVRALRDVMWQMRNDVAAKSMIRRGYSELMSNVKIDDGSPKLFVKPLEVLEGNVYMPETDTVQRLGKEFLDSAEGKGFEFFELAEPMMINGKYRTKIALTKGNFNTKRIDEVIPYRVGEYRRIYSDQYFVKIKAMYEVDGEMKEVSLTHRTAATKGEADAYVKALSEAQRLFKEGKLSTTEAARLMQPYGYKPEEIIADLTSNKYGSDFKVDVKYNRMDDDYVSETIGLSSNFSSKRGDRVLSVHGVDTVNTVSPLDAIASEIGNTAYVASVTEWRESNVIRWFNSFVDDLPENVKSMSPDQAFAYMLNNKGYYIGQNKRLAVAEKVQDYIVAQLNIPTKEEKEFLGFMRMISESVEGKFTNKPVAKFGAALRATKDYPTWARTVAFHSFFAFNPVQFFMQGMNAFNAMAISPIHGIKAAKASSLYGLALMSEQEGVWRAFAKANKLTSLGLGMSEDEFVTVIQTIRRSGLLDGINTTSLYGAETGKYGLFNGLRRKVGTASALPFNAGEGLSRLVSFDIARREWIAANPGKAWWTDDVVAKLLERQDDLTQNMTRANTATWQQGWKSIPAQFIQYQVKLMMNVIQSLAGNSRAFTKSEAIQLLITHAVVMGTAGNFLWPFRDLVNDALPDMTEEQRLYVQQGVVAGLIGTLSDGEAKLALGSRFNTFKYYEDIVKGLLDPQKTFLEVAGGPSGFAGMRILGGVGEALSIVVKAPMTQDTLTTALATIGKSSFSALNNVQKARIAMANYNQVMSSSGRAMYRVTNTEAWLMGFGIPPAAQEDLSILYASKKEHDADLKSASKVVANHSMLALTALRNNDQAGFKTHSAVVQAVLNTYSGSDLQQLYKEAYKVEAFTQYEKMVTDQMVKQWKVRDLVVNKGENK